MWAQLKEPLMSHHATSEFLLDIPSKNGRQENAKIATCEAKVAAGPLASKNEKEVQKDVHKGIRLAYYIKLQNTSLLLANAALLAVRISKRV